MARILLAGGGSAGHVNPLLATADELRRRHPDAAIEVVGTETGLEKELVPAAGYPLTFIPRARLPRGPSPELLTLPARLRSALATTGRVLDEFRPDVVVGFGGYVSTPAYRAAFGRGIPVVVHEQNARPGLANRYGARRAAVVALTFASTPLAARRGRTVVTGMPLRGPVAELAAAGASGPVDRAAAARELGLDPSAPTVLITGGSLGAASINAAAAGALPRLAAAAQVLHLTGTGKSAAVLEAHREAGAPANYHVREYLTGMHRAYACADLVVTRSGAGMVCELSALGLPALYVPLPIGNGEQRLNAADVVAAGGGEIIDDADLTPEMLASRVEALVADAGTLRSMGERAASAGTHDGAARLADEIESSW
ncbi:MAG: undecaprenyldiphospho-muramoylpentapeptide beta-N-acetylglucosaminyltransferase [Actinobacteria bacterium]|nr:undecaprenyldiphospho-muramoylpentapeptide beta-N-acetylglucosaminyltransferase [Actinomycetota bacterium]